VALGGGLRQIPTVAFGGFQQLGGCLFPLILSFLSFLGRSGGVMGSLQVRKTQKVLFCPLILFS
jgi:hypothetical protein